MQDDRYSKYIGKMAIVPMTYGRHVPIIGDKVNHSNFFCNHTNLFVANFCFTVIKQSNRQVVFTFLIRKNCC